MMINKSTNQLLSVSCKQHSCICTACQISWPNQKPERGKERFNQGEESCYWGCKTWGVGNEGRENQRWIIEGGECTTTYYHFCLHMRKIRPFIFDCSYPRLDQPEFPVIHPFSFLAKLNVNKINHVTSSLNSLDYFLNILLSKEVLETISEGLFDHYHF